MEQFPEASLTFTAGADGVRRSVMHQLMELLFSGPRMGLGGVRSGTYGEIAQVAQHLGAAERSRVFDLLVAQLQSDRTAMTQEEFLGTVDKLLLFDELSGDASANLALQVIQAIPLFDDPQASIGVLARLVRRLDMDSTAPLSIYFALLDVGIYPASLGEPWHSPIILARRAGLARISQSDPRLAGRLIVEAAAGASSPDELAELSVLLPALSSGALLLLPADVFQQLLAHVDERSRARVLSRWARVRGTRDDVPRR